MNKEVVSHSESEGHCFQTVSRSPTFFQVTAVSSPLLTAHLVATDNNRIIKPSPVLVLGNKINNRSQQVAFRQGFKCYFTPQSQITLMNLLREN
jgi:hypothetical protein